MIVATKVSSAPGVRHFTWLKKAASRAHVTFMLQNYDIFSNYKNIF